VFRALDGPSPESRLVIGWKPALKLDPALIAFLSVAVGGSSADG
jgi:LysR family transcriptional regulator, benzoate and cis,cis-muconate-responsive activator of ben and cat genes